MRYLIIAFLLVASPAYAERFVCQQGDRLITREGDCMELGICSGFNNSGIQPGCIIATETEFKNAGKKHYKLDASIISGTRIVEMSQAEKDAQDAAEAQAQANAQTAQADELNVSLKEAFTAFVKVYNSKVPPQYRMTKQEIIQQIKADKGL